MTNSTYSNIDTKVSINNGIKINYFEDRDSFFKKFKTKSGRIRSNIMGKRCDYSPRSVLNTPNIDNSKQKLIDCIFSNMLTTYPNSTEHQYQHYKLKINRLMSSF
jgi:hypothetical protein